MRVQPEADTKADAQYSLIHFDLRHSDQFYTNQYHDHDILSSFQVSSKLNW